MLTFDDASKTHFTTVRPILKKYGFRATFFITQGFDFSTNKRDYLTWDEIAQLHRDGFEIGNHTRDHLAVNDENLSDLPDQLQAIADACQAHGIPRPVSFAYPGNAFTLKALDVLRRHGIRWARRGTQPERPYAAGHGLPYQIGLDHPLLIPTAGDARPDWTDDDFLAAAESGTAGRIAVLQFHGVPDRPHPWVATDPAKFERWMKILSDRKYTVIALRDLERYVPAGCEPNDPEMVIRDRRARLADHLPLYEFRCPGSEQEWAQWLAIMVRHHFTVAEMMAATGADEATIKEKLRGYHGDELPRVNNTSGTEAPLEVTPYPGGRHPRLGFRDGAVRPQRDTKLSVFVPWAPRDYVVIDLPEAIWMNTPDGRRLLYLAHTHVPTIWDHQRIALERQEWQKGAAGDWHFERVLPNKVSFGTRVRAGADAVVMDMWLHNGTSQVLTGLRVQNCAMLAAARDFCHQSNENKIFRPPYAAVRNAKGDRWVIFAWYPCVRAWGNVRVPCLHSDPQFPDCEPGATSRLVGRLSFYQGSDIEAELKRLDQLKWWEDSHESN